MLFRAILIPLTTAPEAISLTILLPQFLITMLIIAAVAIIWGMKRKEKITKRFWLNLLPLVVAWPTIGLSMTVLWEQKAYFDCLPLVIWPYFFFVACALWLTRKTLFWSISTQSLLSLYAVGQYFCCGMAISGKWL
jgi:hypothetical protein